ncbi:hypothetical protein POMI540_0087 [Schizosaccharomyces pombe]
MMSGRSRGGPMGLLFACTLGVASAFYSTKPLWDKNSPEYKQLRSEIEAAKRDEEVKNGELIDPNVTSEDEKL